MSAAGFVTGDSGKGRPRLTIATVVKDDQVGLRRTLDSIHVPLGPEVQLLVVDGSLNPEVVQSDMLQFGPAEARTIWSPPEGVYAAMNLALAEAEGEYIWFLNAGDRMHDPAALTSILETLSTEPQWAVGRVQFISADGASVLPPPWDYGREARSGFSRGFFPPHQGTVVRTALARKVGGFDPSYRVAADYALILRLSRVSEPSMSRDVWADFYEGGLSSTAWRTAIAEFHRARREILDPAGIDAAYELLQTARQFGMQWVYRSLLAPDRPMSSLWEHRRSS